MKIMHILIVMALVCGFTAGCNMPQKAALQAADAAPQAWIDAPLDGSTLPLGEAYEVVFHIANLGGVAQGELSINEAVLALLPNPKGNESPATLRQIWNPDQPGTYTLKARAQSTSGQWSDYVQAVVTVGDITETPTITETITPTPSPTQTLTVTPTPTSASAAETTLTFSASASTSQFFYGGCAPGEVSVAASVSPADNVHDLLLFSRLQDTLSGERTEWSNDDMASSGAGNFAMTISGNSVPERERFSSAFWQYQLVATNKAGEVIGRSQTYSDVTLSKCGEAEQPPQVIPQVITTTVAPKQVVPPKIKVITITPVKAPIIK